MKADVEAFEKITTALKQQADRLIDMQHDLFALAAAVKNQSSTDQKRLEQDFRAVRLVLGKGRPLTSASENLIRLLLVHDVATTRRPIVDVIGELGLEGRSLSSEDVSSEKLRLLTAIHVGTIEPSRPKVRRSTRSQ
jgi:hypothetical protein